MKTQIKFKLILLISLLNSSNTFAHALWIETNNSSKIKEKQEIKVFFGEYSAKEKDSVKNWFSNLEDFSLWLTTPDGQKKQIECSPQNDHFKANFTPDFAGVYVLSIDHIAKDLYNSFLIHYFAIAVISVEQSFQKNAEIHTITDLALQVEIPKIHKVKSPIDVYLFYKNNAFSKGEITIQPPIGWAKEFKLNAKGFTTFEPFCSGKYMIEGTFTDKTTGIYNKQTYQSVWNCVTYCLDVID